jgi:integrase
VGEEVWSGVWVNAANRAVRLDTIGKGDQRWLLQKKEHGTWYVVVEVPKKLREAVGKPRFIKSLQTTDLREAQSKRWTERAIFQAVIDDAKNGLLRAGSDLQLEAREVRSALLTATDSTREMIMEGVSARLDELNHKFGEARYHPNTGEELEPIAAEALQYAAIVSGEAEALDTYLDRWLKGTNYAERTKADAKTAISNLEAWLIEVGKPAFISTIDDRTAADFRDLGLRAKGAHAKTANKKLSALRQYWGWMASSGILASDRNPWDGKSLPKPKAHQISPDSANAEERPFTDAEVVALLNGDADHDLSDIMFIAALSGLRLEEIGQLRVRECERSLFNVTRSKTKAGIRTVPIHQDLVEIIGRRTKDRGQGEFIFPDLEASGWDDARTMAVSKRFATYRRGVAVDDKREGARRSKVNFHSFRRWFARQCELAGQSESVVSRVMGHSKGINITFGVYSQAMPVDPMRACVECVTLPDGVIVSTRADVSDTAGTA